MTIIAAVSLVLSQAGTSPVRVVNAVVDSSPIVVQIGGQPWGSVAYGARGAYMDVPAGKREFSIETVRGERLANPVEVALQSGYPHTVIFCGKVAATGRLNTVVLRDTTAGKPSTSTSQIMFVNALSDGAAVSIQVNEKAIRPKTLAVGASSNMINSTPRDNEIILRDEGGRELYRTTYKSKPATRVTFIAMGAKGLPGNRGPRLFAYDF